uniref:Molybdopterin synthase sulfur carrier subunit n=1 Tax=Globodera rostochiensis TaxID=31243 RepID=A0A914HZY8_GLORO
MDTIEVRILLFGKAREVAECHEIRRHLPKTLTSAELYDHIFEKTIRDSCILALDQRYCFERTAAGETETIILEANSEIAVIPPISGG